MKFLCNILHWARSLLCMVHVKIDNEPIVYPVFEYMGTDLKKYIDMHGRGSAGSPLQAKVVQVRSFSFHGCAIPLPTNAILECSWNKGNVWCMFTEFHVPVVQRTC